MHNTCLRLIAWGLWGRAIEKESNENILKFSLLSILHYRKKKCFRPRQGLAVNSILEAFFSPHNLFLVSFSLFLDTIGMNFGEPSLGVYPGEGDLESKVFGNPFT